MIEPLYDINNLYAAFKTVQTKSGWKEQTQKYAEDLLLNLVELKRKLVTGKYRPKEPNTFILRERGKTRLIESYSIDDRIVQRCFTHDVILPLVRPKLVYDNDASLEKRGTEHFRKRLTYKLRRYAKKHGNNGYILLGDFTKFFDNIWHDIFIQCLKELGADDDVLDFTRLLLDAHAIDVSYMTDNEFAKCMDVPFNALEYCRVDKSLLDGSKVMRKSVGIGSHIAQTSGVVVPYKLDNYIKIVCGVEDYARYNDDFYVISESKDFLRSLLVDIKKICSEHGIFLNAKKTQIVPLGHRFSILQTIYFVKDDGFVVEIPNKSGYSRERKRIKKYSLKVKCGKMPIDKYQGMYVSWRNSITKRHGTKRSIESIDKKFFELSGRQYSYKPPKRKIKRSELFNW